MSAQVRTEVEGVVATVLLDGPESHNVLSGSGWLEMARVFEQLSQDDALQCVVVRGVGGRAFSAGSDISYFEEQRDTRADAREYSKAIAHALEAIRECRHPTVAIIEGLCVGGGLEISSCCDVRVCGTSARFGAPINRLGLTMAHTELEPLLTLLGPAPVLDLLLTGDLIGAERAREVGLVSRVFADEEVLEQGYALVGRITSGAPLVNRWHKLFVRQLVTGEVLTRRDRDVALEAFQTRDYREGRDAFLAKRTPDFTGE